MGLSYIDRVAVAVREQLPDELMSDEQGVEDLFRLYGLLALAKGTETTAEDVHDAWAVWTVQRGKDHHCVRPFQELGATTQDEDRPFVEAIHAACRAGLPEARA
jgi:hypothetical protein